MSHMTQTALLYAELPKRSNTIMLSMLLNYRQIRDKVYVYQAILIDVKFKDMSQNSKDMNIRNIKKSFKVSSKIYVHPLDLAFEITTTIPS